MNNYEEPDRNHIEDKPEKHDITRRTSRRRTKPVDYTEYFKYAEHIPDDESDIIDENDVDEVDNSDESESVTGSDSDIEITAVKHTKKVVKRESPKHMRTDVLGWNNNLLENDSLNMEQIYKKYLSNFDQKLLPLQQHQKLTKDFQHYSDLLIDINTEFTKDLPLHLYTAHLLSTKNLHLPPKDFTSWPSPSSKLIPPRSYLSTTDFQSLNILPSRDFEMINNSKYVNIDYRPNYGPKLRVPTHSMLEYWHPQINSGEEIRQCIDSLYEKKINTQIQQYSESKKIRKNGKLSKYTYQRRVPEDLHLDDKLKDKIVERLDEVIDKLISINTEKVEKLENNKKPGVDYTTFNIDWLSVMSSLGTNEYNKKMKTFLLKLFNLKLEKDKFNGPLQNILVRSQQFTESRNLRNKVLKRAITTTQKKNSKSSGFKESLKVFKQSKKQKSNIRNHLDDFMKLSIVPFKYDDYNS